MVLCQTETSRKRRTLKHQNREETDCVCFEGQTGQCEEMDQGQVNQDKFDCEYIGYDWVEVEGWTLEGFRDVHHVTTKR